MPWVRIDGDELRVDEARIGTDQYVWMASTLGGNPISTAAANAGRTSLTRTAAPVATRATARATGRSSTSILPLFDRRGFSNDFTLN